MAQAIETVLTAFLSCQPAGTCQRCTDIQAVQVTTDDSRIESIPRTEGIDDRGRGKCGILENMPPMVDRSSPCVPPGTEKVCLGITFPDRSKQ